MHTPLFAFCLVVMTATLPVGAIPANHGEQLVGFKSYWLTDPARTYRTAFDDGKTYGATKSPRPVLVNMWYPTREGGSPMAHGNYLEYVPDDPKLRPLALALLEYNRKVIAKELIGIEVGKANELQQQAFAKAMKRNTGCFRNAPAAPGRYPLIIYHSGAGSSFEDNTVLCEELARSGFVVIGSAFQDQAGKTFNIDALNAGREFEFLIRHSAGMENVDVNHIGLVGHSAGAHGSLIYAARPGIAVDAVVSLDTTQDYVTLADKRWGHLVTALTEGHDQYKTPTMFVAGPTALFELADTLVHSERIYLTMPVLTHNEYILQGEMTAAIEAELNPKSKEEPVKRAEAVAKYGKELRRLVRLYFAAKLKGNKEAFEEIKKLQQTRLGEGARVEMMPVGATEMKSASMEVNPRSILLILKKSGAEAVISELRKLDKKNILVHEAYQLAFQLQYYLANNGKAEQAKQLFEYYLSVGVDTRGFLVTQCDYIVSIKAYPRFVEGCVRLGQVIGGDNQKVKEMVGKYGKREAGR